MEEGESANDLRGSHRCPIFIAITVVWLGGQDVGTGSKEEGFGLGSKDGWATTGEPGELVIVIGGTDTEGVGVVGGGTDGGWIGSAITGGKDRGDTSLLEEGYGLVEGEIGGAAGPRVIDEVWGEVGVIVGGEDPLEGG